MWSKDTQQILMKCGIIVTKIVCILWEYLSKHYIKEFLLHYGFVIYRKWEMKQARNRNMVSWNEIQRLENFNH